MRVIDKDEVLAIPKPFISRQEIEDIPEVEFPQWISVKDRLPEHAQRCLVTRKVNTKPPFYSYSIATFSKDLRKTDRYDFWDCKGKPGFYAYDSEWGHYKVEADYWMPIVAPESGGAE